jgi:sec-independent protein translocase protein TatA
MDIFSPIHLLIVLAIALLIFGPRRLPEIGTGLGKTIRAFKGALNGDDEGTKPGDTER